MKLTYIFLFDITEENIGSIIIINFGVLIRNNLAYWIANNKDFFQSKVD